MTCGNRRRLCLHAALVILLFASCASHPSRAAARPALEASVPARTAADPVPIVPVNAPVSTALETMRELRDAADAAFDTNHPVEALRHLVGILALNGESVAETDQQRAAERGELVRKADAQLTSIGARLTLEPTDNWLSAGSQIAGNVRDLSRGSGPQPSVRLVINYDFGKAVVADAPIRFRFVDGAGDLTGQSSTDSYGLASTTVRSVSRADRPAVVRAMLVVANRGMTRAFSEVSRDFTYLPPSRTARVLAQERPRAVGDTALSTSPLTDAVSRGLSASGLELLPSPGNADRASFDAVASGDSPSVVAALSGSSYLVLALTEYDTPRQMVNKGRTYDIFTVTARTRLRILRSDGSVVTTRPVLNSVGRGGSAEAAIQTALAASRSAVEADLVASAAQILSSLD